MKCFTAVFAGLFINLASLLCLGRSLGRLAALLLDIVVLLAVVVSVLMFLGLLVFLVLLLLLELTTGLLFLLLLALVRLFSLDFLLFRFFSFEDVFTPPAEASVGAVGDFLKICCISFFSKC